MVFDMHHELPDMLVPPTIIPRQWQRVPVCIPVFIRGTDDSGEEFFEFAAIVNLSAGGALLALRRYIPDHIPLTLEIPGFPLGDVVEKLGGTTRFQARTVHRSTCDGYHVVGVQFPSPLLPPGELPPPS